MTALDLNQLIVGSHQLVTIAFSADLTPELAVELAQRVAQRLRAQSVPPARCCYIVCSGPEFDDTNAALLLAALEPITTPARLRLHDPDDPDRLWFQRRLNDERRGGIFLSADWMRAGVRIACGEPASVLAGLSAWFSDPAELDVQLDLNADAIVAAEH